MRHELGLVPLCDVVHPPDLCLLRAPAAAPLASSTQDLASAVAEGAGYIGLILFVLRAPDNEPDPKRRWLERVLPGVGILLALLMLASYGTLTGHRTDLGTRIAVLIGFVVAICAVAILLERITSAYVGWSWGCLIRPRRRTRDRYFKRTIGGAILNANEPFEVDRILAERPFRCLSCPLPHPSVETAPMSGVTATDIVLGRADDKDAFP
jgi:hypothetical protein